MQHQDYNRQLLHRRLNTIAVFIAVTFGVLVVRLWQLQVLQGAYYALRAENNRVRTIQLVAPRGTISDRHNMPLVENRSAFNILLYRESASDMEATSRFLVQKLGVKESDLAARLRRGRSIGLYRPVVIKEDVGIDDISVVEAFGREHAELQLGPEPRRFYRYGKLAAHVLGYVGEVSEEELSRESFSGTKPGDLVGKSGVERTYNSTLTGIDGTRQVLADSIGREVGFLEEIDAVVGGELQLTLDLGLQMTAEKLLENKVGAIVAMDPRNGEILAMASAPAFDPNNFSTRISEQEWNELVEDPNRPLQNRSIQNSYPPGSTFKLIVALAGLEQGQIRDDTRIFCRGSAAFYGRPFLCWFRKGHGFMELENAIQRSCNVYFYEMGRRLGISKIAEYAQLVGLGDGTGIDLPGEREGLMPTPEWKQLVRKTKWFAGETISVSIGQGAVSVTPLQLARAVGALATNGRLTQPHVFLRSNGAGPIPAVRQIRMLPISEEFSRKIREGMWASVNNFGTGHRAAVAGLDVCGKTGTVQVIGNEKKREAQKDPEIWEDHSWFVGFANKDDPEIVLAVFLEHGGKGGAAAAPLAQEMFRAYFSAKARREGKPWPNDQISEARR